jgi:hypothetical protein
MPVSRVQRNTFGTELPKGLRVPTTVEPSADSAWATL